MDGASIIDTWFGGLILKKNQLMWVIALLIVNTGWIFLSGKMVPQEINRPGADFAENRAAELDPFFSDEIDYKIEYCFKSSNGVLLNYSLVIKQGSTVLFEDQGTTDDGCKTFSSTGKSGDLDFQTTVDSGIDSEVTLYTKPLGNVMWEGIFLFSIGTLVVAYLETGLRHKIKEKVDNRPQPKSSIPQELEPVQNEGIWQTPLRPK
ncbi:MAG: hypothetical protein CXT71_02390 [Methanobacteriota archaeon]|nr:MAG: hypothetical protein CXT71_02390 [Euryarchaeota archaeon]